MHPAILPVVTALVAIGGGVAWKLTHKLKPTPPPQTTPPTPQGNPITPLATIADDAKKANAADLGPLPAGFDTYADWVQKQSPAMPMAHALYDYLKAYGIDHSDKLRALTKSFQQTHNSNRISKGIGGQLDEDGEYDALTSAALTMYTGDPIPPDLSAKPPKEATLGQVLTSKVIGDGGTNIGSAYSSGFNVIQWLKKNGTGNLAAPDLQHLVTQFEHDMNTDPLFPGPNYKPSPKPPMMFATVDVNGDIGNKGSDVRKALRMQVDPSDGLYGWF